MTNSGCQVTLCITPRERFSCSVDSLQDIVRNTDGPYELVYVDANSPPEIAAELSSICHAHRFTYLRKDEYLPPNRARNIGLQQVRTPFVVFLDNDLFVSPGWLDALLDCALETGAWAVGPVILEGSAALQVIHMAGGDLTEESILGYNRLRQTHRFMLQTLSSVQDQLIREPVGSFEFHCVLVKREGFTERSNFLDEGFLSHQEHLDLAREIRLAGGEVYFEPGAVVRYDNARKFEDYDREYFELRWSPQWTEQSLEHARKKWGLGPQDRGLARLQNWTSRHRQLFEKSQTPWARHILPKLMRRKAGAWLREHKLLPEKQTY